VLIFFEKGKAMKVKQTLHNNSPTILAAFGVVGFISAIVMTAKAAPKAERVLEDVPEDAPIVEKIKAVSPIYAPTAGMILISTACIVGSNRIHRYRYASLLALYSIGEKTLERWQESTLEAVGKKKFEKVEERVREPRDDPPSSMIIDDNRVLFYDLFSGRHFHGNSIESVRKVVNDLNDQMYSEDFASVNDFYYGVGLDRMEYGSEWGWNIADGAVTVEFDAFIKNERPVVSVSFPTRPKEYK
jgi:hypothetical protein